LRLTISLRSAPAAKALSDPTRTMQPTESSWSNLVVASFIARIKPADSGLSLFS